MDRFTYSRKSPRKTIFWRNATAPRPRTAFAERRPGLLRLAPWVWLLVACVCAMLTALAEDLPDPDAAELAPGERVEALLGRLKLEQSRLRTLEASFVQKKQSPLLLEPEESRGLFSFRAPDLMRWEYAAPSDTVVLVAGGEMLTWYRGLGRAERVRLGKRAERVLGLFGATPSLSKLESYFTVRVAFPKSGDIPYRLELEPSSVAVARRVRGMEMHIDRRLFVPTYLQYLEPDGGSTELSFTDLRPNAELPEARFELDLPDGVEISDIDWGGSGAF